MLIGRAMNITLPDLGQRYAKWLIRHCPERFIPTRRAECPHSRFFLFSPFQYVTNRMLLDNVRRKGTIAVEVSTCEAIILFFVGRCAHSCQVLRRSKAPNVHGSEICNASIARRLCVAKYSHNAELGGWGNAQTLTKSWFSASFSPTAPRSCFAVKPLISTFVR